MNKKIYAAIIGLGVGIKHFEAIDKLKNSAVIGVYDLNKKKSINLKNKYPKIKIYKDEDEIFKDKKINLISIASYDEYHFKQIEKCFKYGKHFIIEKPMCSSSIEFKQMLRLNKRYNKVKFISNLPLRTEPIFKFFKKIMKKEKVFYIEADYLWGRYKKLYEWRSKSKNYSVINGAAIHMIDIVIWMLGINPTHIFVSSNNIVTKSTKFKKNSLSVILLYFSNGIIAKITANACSISPHNHNVSIFSKDLTMRNDIYSRYIISKKGMKNLNKIKYPDKFQRSNLITSFVNNLMNSKKKPLITKDECFFLTKVCLAGIKSEKKQKKVKI